MRITLLTVGHLKENYWKQAAAEYQKRLGTYAKVEIQEVEDERTPERAAPAEEAKIREREGRRLLERLPERAYCIALAIEGEQVDSVALAERLGRIALYSASHLVFIIGGSLGLSDEVLSKADWKLSFSRMTFPHQLMRVILLEQIYRSFRILRNEPYHK